MISNNKILIFLIYLVNFIISISNAEIIQCQFNKLQNCDFNQLNNGNEIEITGLGNNKDKVCYIIKQKDNKYKLAAGEGYLEAFLDQENLCHFNIDMRNDENIKGKEMICIYNYLMKSQDCVTSVIETDTSVLKCDGTELVIKSQLIRLASEKNNNPNNYKYEGIHICFYTSYGYTTDDSTKQIYKKFVNNIREMVVAEFIEKYNDYLQNYPQLLEKMIENNGQYFGIFLLSLISSDNCIYLFQLDDVFRYYNIYRNIPCNDIQFDLSQINICPFIQTNLKINRLKDEL